MTTRSASQRSDMNWYNNYICGILRTSFDDTWVHDCGDCSQYQASRRSMATLGAEQVLSLTVLHFEMQIQPAPQVPRILLLQGRLTVQEFEVQPLNST